jgi:hypothetical protein
LNAHDFSSFFDAGLKLRWAGTGGTGGEHHLPRPNAQAAKAALSLIDRGAGALSSHGTGIACRNGP